MIVREYQGKLLLVRQTDHMTLSGQLAEVWGNDRFARPVPFGPLVVAAAEHDAGWAAWESAPKVDPATRRPYQFTDLPVEEHLALYREGVNAVAARGAHAGLLVNLHCQGLYNQRFGTTPEMTMRRLAPEQADAVRRALAARTAPGGRSGRCPTPRRVARTGSCGRSAAPAAASSGTRARSWPALRRARIPCPLEGGKKTIRARSSAATASSDSAPRSD